MTTPDVRVRLSSEGVAEVVSALKKIQAEGQKASQRTGRSFLNLNSVLGNTTKLLAGLGLAVGVGALVTFIRRSADAADQVGKLGQKVGASVQNLSALNLAAATSAVSSEQLATGLTYLNRKIAELAEGSPKAQSVFRQLGLSAKDFKGKDAVEAFDLVSQRLAKVGDGATKTATAMEIFGRSGAQLIPLINSLADEGLAKLIDRARELGVLLDEQMVASIQRTNDDMKILELQSRALGAQFATGIAPALSQSLQIVTGDLGNTTEAWRKMGEVMGWIAKVLVAVVAGAIDLVVTGLQQTVGWIDAIGRAGGRLVKGDFGGAGEELSKRWAAEDARAQQLAERLRSRYALAFQTPAAAEPREARPGADVDSVELVRRQADATKSIRDAELAYLKAQLKARQDAEKRSYEEGASSLQEYFGARRRIITEEADAEVAALLARKALLSTETDEIKAQAEARTIDLQVNKLRLEQEAAIAALTAEETKALRDMGAKALELERQLLEARGRRHEAAMLAIDEELQKVELLLQGMADEERTSVLAQFRASMAASANYEERQRQAQAAMTDLGLERQRIDARIRAGLITQLEGEQQIMTLELARVGTLEQIAKHLTAAAEATGDPAKIQEAREFALAVEEIGMAAEAADASMVRLRDAIEQSGLAALTDLFAEGIRAGVTFRSAMADMASSVVQSIRRITSEMLAMKIIMATINFFSPGGHDLPEGKVVDYSTAASGGLMRHGRITRFSSGGLLRGPGSGTSDRLVALSEGGRPVRLSNGEFVVRAAAVQQPGALDFLRDFNRLSMATLRPARPAPGELRFAEGGMIGSAGAGGQPLDGRLTVGLEEGLVLKALESSRGQRILVELISRNRRTLQRVL